MRDLAEKHPAAGSGNSRGAPRCFRSNHSSRMVKVRRPFLLTRAVRGSLHGRCGGRTVEDHAEGWCGPPDRASTPTSAAWPRPLLGHSEGGRCCKEGPKKRGAPGP